MRGKGSFYGIAIVALSMAVAVCCATAQTPVTETGGAANYVPVFTSASAVKNSVITQSGSNVGIGTTSPLTVLHVSSPTDNAIRLDSGVSARLQLNRGSFIDGTILQFMTAGTTFAEMGVYGSSNNIGFETGSGKDMENGATPQMVLTPSGYVGIGTTNPSSALEVSGNGNQVITLQSTTTGYPGISFNNTAGVYTNQLDALTAGLYWWNGSNRTMALAQNGNLSLTGSVTYADNSTQSTAWTGVLCGGDYSESVDVTGDRENYAAGDVLVINPQAAGSFLKSAEPYSTAVTGIYATKPGVVGRRQKTDPKTSTTEVPMAMIGIVPTRVSAENGSIRPGDLLVTSATLGYAMKGTDRTRMLGAVIGKALGSLDSGTGMIEAVVTLQ